MKSIACILLIFSATIGMSQSTLNAGDLAIVHYNSDNPDEVSFLCLSPVDSGTKVFLTDNGWLSSLAFRSGEGVFTWVAAQDYSCGDVVHLDSIAPISLSSAGDQLLVFQDSVSAPRFITAFNNEGAGIWQSTASSANTSALPPGLINGTNAVALLESDNVVYDSSRSGSRALISSLVFNSAAFTSSNTVRQSWSGSFAISSGCVLPVQWLSISLSHTPRPSLIWETASEEQSDFFQVELSLDGEQFQAIGQVNAAGFSTEIRRYSFELPPSTIGYIRLKQVDFNGDFSYSKTIVVKENSGIDLVLNNGMYQLDFPGEFELSIFNSVGALIQFKEGFKQLMIPENELESGWMIVHFKAANLSKTFKIFRSY